MKRVTRGDWLTISLVMVSLVLAPAAWVHLGALLAVIVVVAAVVAAAVAWFSARE